MDTLVMNIERNTIMDGINIDGYLRPFFVQNHLLTFLVMRQESAPVQAVHLKLQYFSQLGTTKKFNGDVLDLLG